MFQSSEEGGDGTSQVGEENDTEGGSVELTPRSEENLENSKGYSDSDVGYSGETGPFELSPPALNNPDSEDFSNIYSEDPQFKTDIELKTFLENFQPPCSEKIDSPHIPMAARVCTCHKCVQLSHSGGDYICCRQSLEKWRCHMSEEEKNSDSLCITDTTAFNSVVNNHSLRVLILCSNMSLFGFANQSGLDRP